HCCISDCLALSGQQTTMHADPLTGDTNRNCCLYCEETRQAASVFPVAKDYRWTLRCRLFGHCHQRLESLLVIHPSARHKVDPVWPIIVPGLPECFLPASGAEKPGLEP